MIIHITGPAGSGKTTLARALRPRVHAHVVIMDGRDGNWAGLAQDLTIRLSPIDSPAGRVTSVRVDPSNGAPPEEFIASTVPGGGWVDQAVTGILSAYPYLKIPQ